MMFFCFIVFFFSKDTICFLTRKPSKNPCVKLKHSHLFPLKSRTLKKEKRWHALSRCCTRLSGRTSYRHTGHSVSVQWLRVTLCTMTCQCIGLCVCVDESVCVCVCVQMPQIKKWSLPEINCFMLNIRATWTFQITSDKWYIGHVLWCLRCCASLSLITAQQEAVVCHT